MQRSIPLPNVTPAMRMAVRIEVTEPFLRFHVWGSQISFRRPTQRPDGGPAPKMCSTMRLALGSSVLSEALTSEPPSRPT